MPTRKPASKAPSATIAKSAKTSTQSTTRAKRARTTREPPQPHVTPVPASVAIELQPPSEFTSAAEFFPARESLPSLRRAAATCQACDLWRTGTQTVFGEGKQTARVMFVGEQPGDEEDLAGKPFVGPSGRLLNAALENAGIDRSKVYVTNAVKHFKWERTERGEKRMHKTPSTMEGRACRPWLDAEIRVLQPSVVVCLGATAAQAILGKQFRVTQHRGKPVKPPADFGGVHPPIILATVHPSSVLRTPRENRQHAQDEFFADIKRIAKHLS